MKNALIFAALVTALLAACNHKQKNTPATGQVSAGAAPDASPAPQQRKPMTPAEAKKFMEQFNASLPSDLNRALHYNPMTNLHVKPAKPETSPSQR